jgi:uncharacterized protein
MIMIPILSALYAPKVAVPVLLLVDFVTTLPLLRDAVRRCAWREIVPLVGGYAVTLPLGILVLLLADPVLLTRAMAVVVLIVAVAMALGWRRRTAPGRAATLATGGVSGLMAGSIGIGGPPVILFWLSGQDGAARTRANIVVFFALSGIFAMVGYATAGVLTADAAALAVALGLPYGLGLLIGARAFGRTDDGFYRRVALGIIGSVGVTTLVLG